MRTSASADASCSDTVSFTKSNWYSCGCRCCADQHASAPPRRTMPESFQAQVVGIHYDALFSSDWCDFHDHSDKEEREECQRYRFVYRNDCLCSPREYWYQGNKEEEEEESGSVWLRFTTSMVI